MVRGLLVAAAALAAPSAMATELNWRVEGIDGELAANVRAHLGAPREARTLREARILRSRAVDRARDGLKALGYYEPTIKTNLEGDADSGWSVILTIDKGQPVRLRDVLIEVRGAGSDDEMLGGIIDVLQLNEGQVLHHGTYDTAKNALRNRALSQGYFDYDFAVSRIEVNPQRRRADIRLVLDSGPRYRIDRIEKTETPFSDELINRLIDVDTPVPYSADLIARLNRRLIDSGYFKQARVNVVREEAADGTVPVRLNLTAREPNTLGFGFGFSTDEGPRLRANWKRHWLNASGHRFDSEAKVSAVRQNATAKYTIPLRDPLNDTLQLNSGVQAEDIEDSKSLRATAGVQRQQNFTSGWQRVQSLRLLHERFEQADDDENTTLLLPGLSFSRTRVRGQPDPHWGDSQSYGVEIGAEQLLSDINLARFTISNKWLRSINRTHRFTFRVDAGGLTSNSFEEVPSSLRFFAGGDNSIRGFGYRSLSPENEEGELEGGKYLLTGSAEYSYPVVENWRLAAFVDAGNAFNDPADAEVKVGAGPGVRWSSPVGPIRLDVGVGISEEDTPFRLHFSLGPPF